MRRRSRVAYALLAGVLVAAGVLGAALARRALDPVLSALPELPPAVREGLPNIVLISVDTLRKSELGLYDPALPTTPNLDSRGDQFIRFEQTISQAPWTGPAHLALFYSRHPPVDFWERDVVSLTSVLRHYGYATAAFTDGGWLGRGAGIDAGFDVLRSPEKRGGAVIDFGEKLDQVDRWLGEKPEQPFFLFVHSYHTHASYDPEPDQLAPLHPGDYGGRFTGDIEQLLEANRVALAGRRPDVTPADAEHVRALYRAEIREADAFLERLFRDLEGRGLWDGALVAVTSDHGESFFEREFFEHGTGLYDELINVPLLLKVPGSFPVGDRVVQRQIELLDLAPTLLEIAGIESPSVFRGRSFVSLFSDAARAPYPKKYALSSVAETENYGDAKQSVRTEEWKYIFHPATGREELYRLTADPEERRDVARLHPEIAASLRAQLQDAGRLEEVPEPSAALVGPEDREILKALGYIE